MFRILLLVTLTLFIAGQQHTQAQSVLLPHQEIELTKDQPDFSLFDKAFYDNQFFLLGESHGFQRPQQVDLALLKHLNKRVGVRYYIAEVDPTKAYYLNQYLQTGQDSLLRLVFRSWIAETAQWANIDFFRKIQAIRAYNQTLPAKKRIRFVGIDVVQDRPLLAQQLRELTGFQASFQADQPRLDSLVTYLTAAPKKPDSLAAQVAMNWLAKIRNEAATYRNAPGQTMNELTAALTGLGYRKSIRRREPTLFANFRDAVSRLDLHDEKLYGFWGAYHVGLAPLSDGNKSFAAMVADSDLPMRSKMVSLLCRYVDSFMMVPTAFLPPFWQDKGKAYSRLDKFNDNGPMMRIDGIDAFIDQSKPNTVTLFKLSGTLAGRQPITATYSPFMPAEQRLQFDTARPTTDYFQYIVLIRNSEMTQPLDGK
ncbi:erythromycin esterase family protein [Fibrella aquatica]|uniref:erythromycin esterase family protein n=1 Tax=Fibrella aquatica TaxID=3242487 RepID=UPI003520C442